MNPNENENPFVVANEDKSLLTQTIPNFPKTNKFTVYLSEEATTVILKMLNYNDNIKYASTKIAFLLELIGMCAVNLVEPPIEVDEESGVTTEQCRQSGYEDGLMGNPSYFAAIYGNMKDSFQQAYLRGFFEGNFIRNK